MYMGHPSKQRLSNTDTRELRIKIIEGINQTLVRTGHEPISPRDFDILYDMSLSELMETRKELSQQIKEESVH